MDRYEILANTYLAKKDDKSIEAILKKREIVYPSEELAIFKTIYAKVESPNRNNVRLAKDAVIEALPTLVGKQVNLEHLRYGMIVGYILDAWLEGDNIITAFTMHKDIYSEEYKEALEKMAEGELSVSFELKTIPDTVEKLNDGTIKLHNITFSGQGLLINNEPAEETAQVFETAKRILKRVENSNLLFASQLKQTCEKIIEEQFQSKGEQTVEITEEQKAQIEQLKAKHGESVKDWSDEDFLNPEKVAELEATKEGEEKSEDNKEEVKADTKRLSDERYVTTTTYKDDGSVETSQHKVCTYSWVDSEGNTQTESVETKTDVKEMYSKEEVAQIQASLEEQKTLLANDIEALKLENETLKTQVSELQSKVDSDKVEIEQATIRAEKIATLKIELKDNPYVAEFKDEDYLDEVKVKDAKTSKEIDDLKAENEALKNKLPEEKKGEKVEASKKDDLVIGSKDEKKEKTNISSVLRKLGTK